MNTQQKGFTLIELLIVLGILGTLVVAVLVTLNPGEAQKKARDQKRMRDLATLQTIIDQYINDGGVPICELNATGGSCKSSIIVTPLGGEEGTYLWKSGGMNNQSCDYNFLRVDLCKYAKSIPADPRNAKITTFQDGDGDPFNERAMYKSNNVRR